jgi:hypothetical protein
MEHQPPHFHVEFRGETCSCDLEGRPLVGEVGSRRAARLIQLWASRHRAELEANWQRIMAGEPIHPIAPLE